MVTLKSLSQMLLMKVQKKVKKIAVNARHEN